MSILYDAPDDDVIEISVFGRGSGECIVIHLGNQRWMVVDSFTNSGEPIAIIYFREIGVDVATQVEFVLATHWHDDHIKGISQVLSEAKSATGALPAAMLHDEFKHFARKFHDVPAGKVKSGVREMGLFLDVLLARNPVRVELARSWGTLLNVPLGVLAHGLPVTVQAISPSHFDVLHFLGMIGGYALPEDVAVSAPYYDRNDVSVALHIDLGEQAILLGADLETRSNPQTGWDAVLNDHRCPSRTATLYKVAHHGSSTGHHDDIWLRLCTTDPVTTLAPWARGNGRLPTADDVKRILSFSTDAYTAARTATSGKRQKLQTVNSILQNTHSKVRNVDLTVGQTRHRLIGGNWRTDLFGNAVPLSQIAA